MQQFNLFKFVILLGFILLLSIKSKSQDVLIYKSEQKPIIDGSIDPVWYDYPQNELQHLLSGNVSSDNDFSAGYRAVWDLDNLYILVEITDDIKINDSGNDAYQDDAIEIYIDINNNKLTSYGSDDYQYTFRWNDPNIYEPNNSRLEGIKYTILATTTGYLLEVSFPWSTLGLTSIYDNVELGFDVHVHDDDDGGVRDAKLAWFTSVDDSYRNPSFFATASLYGTSTTPASAPKPTFSVKRGFFYQPFDLNISSNLADALVKYTFDGSDPRTSPTAINANLPVAISINPDDYATPAVTINASIIKDGYAPSDVETNTYIFIDKVKTQTHPGGNWPTYNVNGQELDFDMDQSIVNDSRYTDLIEDALLDISSISIITEAGNLFNSQTGIYVNAAMHGRAWERPASIELLNPDGSEGFQIHAGLRIRGGYSRGDFNPKHAFRLFFRDEYGSSKLNYALFGNEGVDAFDKLDLRTSQNHSWNSGNTYRCTMNRDVFSRDLQRDMLQPYTRSRYYHLYINGLYWGLFQSQERAEARFAASYFGGSSDDYDVVKSTKPNIEVTDGYLDAWRDVWNLCQSGFDDDVNYYKLLGQNTDGSLNQTYKKLVDVENLIDYMLVIFYTGNFDAPVSAWMDGNNGTNNFYTIYNRNDNQGFKFFAHDSEHTLLIDGHSHGIGINENRVDLAYRTDQYKMNITNFNTFNPQWLHHKLTTNTEYKILFADLVYKHFFNNGAITPDKNKERFLSRANEIDKAIIGESARWGDAKNYPAKNKDDDWLPAINRIVNEYFPYRTNIVLEQLKDIGLYPNLDAPNYILNSEIIKDEMLNIAGGDELIISNLNSNGTIKYTVDGSDPREIGGLVSDYAIDGSSMAKITISTTTIIKARIKDGDTWSALHKISANVSEDLSNLKITEIHYNPMDEAGVSGDEMEFIEFKNIGTSVLNLTNCALSDGIYYDFPANTKLNPGQFLVLASNVIEFKNRYGFEPKGEYTGQLKNSGEKIILTTIADEIILSVNYSDDSPWPASADGAGNSLVATDIYPTGDVNQPLYWRASSAIHGSPNTDDAMPDIAPILINEVLANTVNPAVDAIELYNPNAIAINIGGWYLTDDRDEPVKWQIPDGTIIQPNSYFVFNNGHYIGDVLEYAANEFGGTQGFSLSSHGEEVYIFSAVMGELTGYSHGYKFDEITEGISYGAYTNSLGEKYFVQQSQITLGNVNAEPKIGAVVFNQIMYDPDNNDIEYIQLKNITDREINLFDADDMQRTWKINGADFDFPVDVSLAADEVIYLIEETAIVQQFREKYEIDENTKVYNFAGKLSNQGETLSLYAPAPTYIVDTEKKNPYVLIEEVKYDNKLPWPDVAENGKLLGRFDNTYSNDPINWYAQNKPIKIISSILTNVVENVVYSNQLIANGGQLPYTWELINGQLPQGLSLDAISGEIKGEATENGSFQFDVRVTDYTNNIYERTINLDVNRNTLPIANNDFAETQSGISVSIDILANDIDNDGDMPYWIIAVEQTANGSVFINDDNTLTYIPSVDFTGKDEILYSITDAAGKVSAAVNIEVNDYASVLTVQVDRGEDDAEELIANGDFDMTSTDLEMTRDDNKGGNQLIGIKFRNITLPKGTKVSNAFIQFKVDETNDENTSLTIQAEKSTNPVDFSNSNKISQRNRTTASVTWNPPAWNVQGLQGSDQQTVDISSVIQEIIDMDTWTSGGSIAIIISGSGKRVAVSQNGDAGGAATLHIEHKSNSASSIPPVANAGNDRSVHQGTRVTLDGNNSYNPSGGAINYVWTIALKPEGSLATLSNKYIVNPTLISDVTGTYKIELVANNGQINSISDEVVISVTNEFPIAIAGNEQIGKPNTQIVFDGSASTDPEQKELSYSWTFGSIPVNSSAVLFNTKTVSPFFVPDVAGEYIVSLIVNDGFASSIASTVKVAIFDNLPPIAVAGNDLIKPLNSLIKLDGRASNDPENATLSYNWIFSSRPTSSSATLSNNQAASPSFVADIPGEYLVNLTVNDGQLTSEVSTVKVTILEDLPPVANAGSDRAANQGIAVSMNGYDSYDPNGNAITYLWSIISKPSESEAFLSDNSVVNPTFFTDATGDYIFSLKVNNGTKDSNQSQVVVSVVNTAPIADAGADEDANIGSMIELDGSNSKDPENMPIEYLWTIKSRPAISVAELSSATSEKPDFTPDVAGDYEISLTVTDGYLTSQEDIVNIVVTNSISVERLTNNNIGDINIYPNPAKAIANVELLLNTKSDLAVTLHGINGQLVKSIFVGTLEKGDHNLTIDFDAERLKGGIYYVKIQQKNAIITKRLVYLNN